jgi:SAM-dependent methyltransferase
MNTNTTTAVVNTGSFCRFCQAPLEHTFVDLGPSPLCETYLPLERLNDMEPFYPLHVRVCGQCFLVQLDQYVTPEQIFSEYAHFSSYSDTWLEHARDYTEMITPRLELSGKSEVVEIASNDGYLLQNFVRKGIPALGVEPAANIAKTAIAKGVPTLIKFFGLQTAREMVADGKRADLIIANNVLAHAPNLNDFVAGIKILLKTRGTVTLEFPHLMRLMAGNQFDTICHEHFSYFSFLAVERIFEKHGLRVLDVEELPTHGGSLRIYAHHIEDESKPEAPRVSALHNREERAGFTRLETYSQFEEQVKETKRNLLDFLIGAKREEKRIAGYGAPGKGNTLLNYCGVRTDFIDYTVDRNPYKHGKFLPGTRIPVFPPSKIDETKPDFVLILPWNFKDEIMKQMEHIRDWGGQFVVPIPNVTIYS